MLFLEPDIQDFIKAFNAAKVRYLVVGGASVILHGYARTTVDLDLWVERNQENYEYIVQAFQIFGMPVFDMTQDNFLNNPAFDVFTFGRPPSCVDLMLSVKGLDFTPAYKRSKTFSLQGLDFKVLCREDLIIAKRQAGRHKDLDDVEQLQKIEALYV
ncbi:hypothetical protein AGMMS49938_02670 [Fibrobacterales bacterium]|nr:hypothetical protein AGMMS49938_02670 [Fibrobacterales bacterium]